MWYPTGRVAICGLMDDCPEALANLAVGRPGLCGCGWMPVAVDRTGSRSTRLRRAVSGLYVAGGGEHRTRSRHATIGAGLRCERCARGELDVNPTTSTCDPYGAVSSNPVQRNFKPLDSILNRSQFRTEDR